MSLFVRRSQLRGKEGDKEMLKPDDKLGDILEKHDKKLSALELVLTGLINILLIYTGVNLILKALKKKNKLF